MYLRVSSSESSGSSSSSNMAAREACLAFRPNCRLVLVAFLLIQLFTIIAQTREPKLFEWFSLRIGFELGSSFLKNERSQFFGTKRNARSSRYTNNSHTEVSLTSSGCLKLFNFPLATAAADRKTENHIRPARQLIRDRHWLCLWLTMLVFCFDQQTNFPPPQRWIDPAYSSAS